MIIIKNKFIASIIIVCVLSLTGCASEIERTTKDFKSSAYGGIDRTVSVYDYNGQLIKEYKGKIDILINGSGVVRLELNGKIINIGNAIIISEEN